MDRVGEVEQPVKGLVNEAAYRSSQFLLLASERQATLDGGLEPLLDTSAPAPVVDAVNAVASSDARTIDFWSPHQPELPLPLPPIHPMVDGKPAVACMTNKAGRSRGYLVTVECKHSPGDLVATPLMCKCMNCESSREANARTRAKRAREGTARKGVSVGFDAFAAVPLSVSVWTCPVELRPFCVGEELRLFRLAAHEMVREIFDRLGAAGAPLFQRGYFHPVGEPALPTTEDQVHVEHDGTTYNPHENIMVAGAAFRYGKAKRVKVYVPKEWLGAEGWIARRWRERLVEIFGTWWLDGEQPPTMNLFFEYRSTPEEKAHAVKYFARPFPGWHSRKDISMRPKALGLAHWKHKADLLSLVSQLTPGGLEAVRNPPCHKCGQAECRPVFSRGSTEERALQAMQRLLAPSYLEQWRIMTPAACVQGIEPPHLDPPRVHAVCDAVKNSLPASSLH